MRRIVESTFKAVLALSVIAAATIACEQDDGGRAEPMVPDTSFIDPITDMGAVEDLFEVHAEKPEYWRVATLDVYDGETWTRTDPDPSGTGTFAVPAMLSRGRQPEGKVLTQTFRILNDLPTGHALPLAQTAEEISGPLGDITWDPVRDEAIVDDELDADTTYTVRSRIVVPTPKELDEEVDYSHHPAPDPRWTALPRDLDPRIREVAKRWTRGATSNYRKVLAIQQRFQRDDFVYSTGVDAAVDNDALLDFLTRTKTGWCQHYSSAMAVMVRTMGLPARIGVGFRAGTRQEDGSYLVRNTDAHVWVEVFFPEYGWLQFEPEHGTAHPNAQPGNYLDP